MNPMPGMMPKMMVMAASTPAATIRPVVSVQVPGVETSDVLLLKMGLPRKELDNFLELRNGIMDSHTRLLQGICCCEKQGVEDCYTSSRCFKYNLLDCFTSRKGVWLLGWHYVFGSEQKYEAIRIQVDCTTCGQR